MLWLKGWQGIGSVRELGENGYVFASFSTVARVDERGENIWGRSIPATDYGAVVRPTPDGGFILTASVDGDLYILKTDANGQITNIRGQDAAQLSPYLVHNFPNPFNPSTTISYSLPHAEHVSLSIHDVLGREIITLVNEKKSAGHHEVTWNAIDSPSGIYLCRMRAGEYGETRKLLLLR